MDTVIVIGMFLFMVYVLYKAGSRLDDDNG